MILTAWDYARFDHLDAASRWQIVEDYRSTEPASAVGRRRAVEDLLEKLCQQVHATVWAPRFDAQAWAMLHHALDTDAEGGQQGCARREQVASWAGLAALTTAAGWWSIFDHLEPDPFTLGRVATLEQAGAAYPRPERCPRCGHPPAETTTIARWTGAIASRRVVVIDISDPTRRGAVSPG